VDNAAVSSEPAGRARLGIFLCFLGAFCEGIDLQAAGVAAAGIRQQFHPDNQLLSYFFSAGTLGLFFGAVIGGNLSDRMGRKGVLVASIACFGLFSLLTPIAWDMDSLIGARLLTGLGLGGALPNLIAIGSERAPPRRRSASVTLIYSAVPLGGALASLVSLLATPAQWRWIFIVGGVVPLAVAPVIGTWLREVRRPPDRGADHPGLLAFLGGGRAGRTLLLWVSFFLALLTLYLLLNWLPTLLAGGGFDKAQIAVDMIAFNLGGCLSALYIGSHLETQLRHRGVLLTFAGLPLLLFLLAQGPRPALVAGLLVFALGAAAIGAQAILAAFAPLCYPTSSRGTGVGFAVGIGRIGSIVGPLLGAVLLGSGNSPSLVLMRLLPIVLLGSACAVTLAWRQPPGPIE